MCKNKLELEDLYTKFKENVASYLVMLESEFEEVNELLNELKNYKPFEIDVREANSIQNALNIAVVISYSRNFKRSFGFHHTYEINKILISSYSKEEIAIHEKIISERDKEFAHSDASANEIKLYEGGIYTSSRRTVRQILEISEIIKIQEMVCQIRAEIEKQLIRIK